MHAKMPLQWGSSLWPSFPWLHTRLPGVELSLHVHPTPGLSMEPASRDVFTVPISIKHMATKQWAALISYHPGWRSNHGRGETSSGSFPFSLAIWSYAAGAFPALGGPDQLFVVSSLLPGSVSAFILGAMPASSSPLILGPEEKAGLGNVLSSPPPPSSSPRAFCIVSLWCRRSPGDQSPTVFF